MENSNSYIEILIQSLQKKVQVLKKIRQENERQYQALKAETMDDRVFEQTMEQKDVYIQELNHLDSGFQKVYDRVKELLSGEKDRYVDEIRTLQNLIRQVMDESMAVEKEEKRNKEAFEQAVVTMRKKGRSVKTANKVATDYYQTMNKLNVITPQFLDQQK